MRKYFIMVLMKKMWETFQKKDSTEATVGLMVILILSIQRRASFEFLFFFKGVVYGQGVYFALNSSYSHRYTGNTSNYKRMFQCRVLVGSIAIGDKSMKVPPDGFDSTGDPSSSIFVCYHDDQCYPEYLITYN